MSEKETTKEHGSLRCTRCSSLNLERSGKEPYRFECKDCGQHHFIVMQLVPVPTPNKRTLEPLLAESDQGTAGSRRVSEEGR
jgi:hypothetical protein